MVYGGEWEAHYGSADGFDRYDLNHDGHIDRNEYHTGKEQEALANLVKIALGAAWADVPVNEIQVENKSGNTAFTVSMSLTLTMSLYR